MQCTLPDPPTGDYSDSLEKFYKESAVVVTQHRSEDNMTTRNRAEPDCKNLFFFCLLSRVSGFEVLDFGVLQQLTSTLSFV